MERVRINRNRFPSVATEDECETGPRDFGRDPNQVKFEVIEPKAGTILLKLFLMTFLLGLALGLIYLGVTQLDSFLLGGVICIGFGGVAFIPLLYLVWLFYKAIKADDPEKTLHILGAVSYSDN